MEIWKDIKGFEGMYQISSFGNIKSLDRYVIGNQHGFKELRPGKQLKPYLGGRKGKGYLRVSLSKEDRKTIIPIHVCVAKTFILNPDNKAQVNHKDLNKMNNHVNNLEWMTQTENIQHYFRNRKGRREQIVMFPINQ